MFTIIVIFQSGENHDRDHDGSSPVGCASPRGGAHPVDHTSPHVLVKGISLETVLFDIFHGVIRRNGLEGRSEAARAPASLHLPVDSPSRPMAVTAKSSGALATVLGGSRPSTPFIFHDPPRRGLHRT